MTKRKTLSQRISLRAKQRKSMNKYYCKRCKHFHYTHSVIGRKHKN